MDIPCKMAQTDPNHPMKTDLISSRPTQLLNPEIRKEVYEI